MVSLLSRGVGLLVRSLAGLSCTQATRCSSLPGALSALQPSTTTWFSKRHSHNELPRRPLTAFFRFMTDQRPLLLKQYPEAKATEICKLLSLEWKGLSESARKSYAEAANEDLIKYKDEVKKYKETLTPHEWETLKEKKKLKRVKRIHIRYRREMTSLGKPKRVRNAFNIFMAENFQDAKETSMMEKMKTLSEEWKKLSDSQRQMYAQLAQDDNIRYENEMKVWEDQMLEIGREDLIRFKARKQLIKDFPRPVKSQKKLPEVTKHATEGIKADKRKNQK